MDSTTSVMIVLVKRIPWSRINAYMSLRLVVRGKTDGNSLRGVQKAYPSLVQETQDSNVSFSMHGNIDHKYYNIHQY